MALDFQQVQKQVKELGESAALREQRRIQDRSTALEKLEQYAEDLAQMREKVRRTVKHYDPNLRCALPVNEKLTTHLSSPHSQFQGTLLAADGSQIMPDRHAEVSYCLVNVGAIQLQLDSAAAPALKVESKLMYDDQLYTETGTLADSDLSLARDVAERRMLADLADEAELPVITLTDGPMELWGSKDATDASAYQDKLDVYLKALQQLCDRGAITAGYVDKPGANMVVRLLEVMLTEDNILPEIKKTHPLRGVTDIDLFRKILQPGERSAVFGIQSKSAGNYPDSLGLHFFYLNVGWEGHPWLARVETPRWVVENSEHLSQLQTVLLQQARIMGRRPYPYLLHRAHEAAVVTLPEKEQVTQMILAELRRRKVEIGEISYKQAHKNHTGKTRYSG
jgi:hypothetical protein